MNPLPFTVIAEDEQFTVIEGDDETFVIVTSDTDWVFKTRVTVSSTPPTNPRRGDVWVVST